MLDGAGVPANGLGNDGDWYIDTVNGNAYKKITGAWVFQLTLKGASGASGIRDGAGVPNNADGSDGNYYLNDSIGDWYLKTAGVWNRVYKSTVDLSGTNTTLSGVVSIAHGGTGASTQQTALNALASVAGTLDFDLLTRFAGGNWGGLHAPGVNPTTKFLRGDLQWQVPPSYPTLLNTGNIPLDAVTSVAHTLSAQPRLILPNLICTDLVGEHGYVKNDLVPFQLYTWKAVLAAAPDPCPTIYATATHINWFPDGLPFLQDTGTNVPFQIDKTKWSLIIFYAP